MEYFSRINKRRGGQYFTIWRQNDNVFKFDCSELFPFAFLHTIEKYF